MTVKLIALYTQPDDPDVFEQHYRDQHLPLVHAFPGLQKVETGRIVAEADGGAILWHRVTEMYFADRDALDAALASKHGQAAAADYAKIAPPGSRLLVQSLDD
ncbi:MAG TPA: EthD family reductase [Streptosporangiaceae bacterium]|jgi:uncharacterized protein (TIGR02118 family)